MYVETDSVIPLNDGPLFGCAMRTVFLTELLAILQMALNEDLA
jgi:hypothetical protein